MNRIATTANATGAVFYETGVPSAILYLRGVNYIQLAVGGNGYHNLFDPRHYKPQRVEADLAAMADWGYRIVRVFLTTNAYDRGFGLSTPGLDQTWITNIVDFLRRATAHGLWVVLTGGDKAPRNYWQLDTGTPTYIDPTNWEILSESFVELVTTRFWQDLFKAIPPELYPTIAYVDLCNEASVDPKAKPFTGLDVVSLWGTRYDLSEPGLRQQAIDDCGAKWLTKLRSVIRDIVPDQLVTASITSPAIEGYPSYNGALPVVPNNVYPLSRDAIASTADLVDLHVYAPSTNGLTLDQQFASMSMAPFQKIIVPHVVGETGADVASYPDAPSAANALITLMRRTFQYQVSGWLTWTWSTPQDTPSGKSLMPYWNLVEDNDALNAALSPKAWPAVG